ncbi:MAG: MptD family putative ECF transporter S component [Chloroflexi bacterium]|nr:MptD family putative ECF transporter S component [Chloroflexota bacterium]
MNRPPGDEASFGVRDLVYIAIFGALWGALEMTLGAYLHLLQAPFIGLLMGALGLALALVGRLWVPRRGSVLMIGVVTALLKALGLGGVVLSPMLAILMETVLAEAALLAGGRASRGSFALAGALGVLWNFFHPFLTQGIIAGRSLGTVYGWVVEAGGRTLNLPLSAVWAIVGLLLALHLLAGGLAGGLAWSVGQAARRRVLAQEERTS